LIADIGLGAEPEVLTNDMMIARRDAVIMHREAHAVTPPP
jgi:hypothetical protein